MNTGIYSLISSPYSIKHLFIMLYIKNQSFIQLSDIWKHCVGQLEDGCCITGLKKMKNQSLHFVNVEQRVCWWRRTWHKISYSQHIKHAAHTHTQKNIWRKLLKFNSSLFPFELRLNMKDLKARFYFLMKCKTQRWVVVIKEKKCVAEFN